MFEFVAPAGLPEDRKESEQKEPIPAATPSPAPPASEVVRRSRREWLELLETRGGMRGLGTARLPSVATIRAYHREREYVPWEASLLDAPARVHGWFAVCWASVFTSVAWLGAGDYRTRLRTFRQVGVPGLFKAQLPPLSSLSGFPRVWVAWWSAVCWSGLKFWRCVMTSFYLLLTAVPILWPIFF